MATGCIPHQVIGDTNNPNYQEECDEMSPDGGVTQVPTPPPTFSDMIIASYFKIPTSGNVRKCINDDAHPLSSDQYGKVTFGECESDMTELYFVYRNHDPLA